jgi:hypothetical protein
VLGEAFERGVWPGVVLGAALYCLDYALTLVTASLYHRRVKDKIVLEGSFELNPLFEKDIDLRRTLSPRFLVGLGVLLAMLALLWYIAVRQAFWPEVFFFTFGGLIFLQLAVQMRHLRNLFFFLTAFGPDGVQGQIQYPRVVSLRQSAFEFLTSACLYAVIFLVTDNVLVLGGMVTCLAMAAKQGALAWRWAKRTALAAPP